MALPDYAWNIIWGLLGALGTFVLLYFTVIQKVSKIDGKLEMILEVVRQGNTNTEDIGKIKTVVRKVVKDVNQAFSRIKTVEQKLETVPPKTVA